jgi:hypothetical protein
MGVFEICHSFGQKRSDILPIVLFFVFFGCNSRQQPPKPSIEITQLPPANRGGIDQMQFIAGRANGAKPGQQIVLYARSNEWWIQPFRADPFTQIQPDSTWKNSTHLGTEYAALLVEPGYIPTTKTPSLPQVGNGIVAVVSEKGKADLPVKEKLIHFSGYDWTVRSVESDKGGEVSDYDPANVSIDQKGYLHLRMALRGDTWTSAEVNLTRSLGYGTYRFVVQDSAHMIPTAALRIFTWNGEGTNDARRELDIELSRWGNPNGKNAQYVIQPFYVPENAARFTVPPGVFTHTFRWESGIATFRTIQGVGGESKSKLLSSHTFTTGVPTPEDETVHLDLYDFHHSKNSVQDPTEVVIEKFEYLP